MFARNKLVPELMVIDLKNSLHFWASLIGFKITYERPEAGFAYLDNNGAQIMLEQYAPDDGQWMTGALEAPFGRGINFQITVDLVEPILERLSEVEWPLFRPCADVWYRADAVEVGQREFLVQDPDGYLVRLVESLGERPRSDFSAAEETAYLLRSPANAERLDKSIGSLRAGKTYSVKLIED